MDSFIYFLFYDVILKWASCILIPAQAVTRPSAVPEMLLHRLFLFIGAFKRSKQIMTTTVKTWLMQFPLFSQSCSVISVALSVFFLKEGLDKHTKKIISKCRDSNSSRITVSPIWYFRDERREWRAAAELTSRSLIVFIVSNNAAGIRAAGNKGCKLHADTQTCAGITRSRGEESILRSNIERIRFNILLKY